MKNKLLLGLASAALIALAAIALWRSRRPQFVPDPSLEAALNGIVTDYRSIITLVDGADALDANTRNRSLAAGRILFWRKQNALEALTRRLVAEYQQAAASGFRRNTNGIRQFLSYLNTDTGLHDADKLAFLDLSEELEAAVPPANRGANPLAAPLRTLHDDLESIQLAYREEVNRVFSQFATRGQQAKREKWEAYIRYLKSIINREQILNEMGDSLPEEPEGTRGANNQEIFGTEFAPKTVALTFDDGPHPRYTEQVLALLRKYGIKACFFELGRNLGTIDANGHAELGPVAPVARKVLDDGDVIGNHTYSHRLLTRLSEEERTAEIEHTNLLLEAVAGRKPSLFRAPYGARNKSILDQITADGLRSVMWTVDSLDWADPIPESIVMRVLDQLNQKHRGIILLHDIHKQSVQALSPLIEELQRQNYTFLGFENGQFVKPAPPLTVQRASPPAAAAASSPSAEPRHNFYRESWAVIVGINDYQHWPKLRYAVNDAEAIEETLVNRFAFKRENVRKLIDGDATREHIMEVLGDELTDGKKVQREDRVFFFFAGHGATRTFEDGRQLGFIVPVDADETNYYATAISMTALSEAADLIPAKHVYFVMDSCYSGLALTRSGGAFARDRSYLEEITRRTARQILTAGGADQLVSDDGPDGHSVFTWALLQGLQGQADLDGNGVITASELGAYISPIVSQFARQTPTVGNLVGSEGGEFLFELKPEPLTSTTQQLDGQALALNEQLASLQKEISAKQEELLRLQQSIQSQTAKLASLTGGAVSAQARPLAVTTAGVKSSAARAYDLDRQGLQFYRQKEYTQAEARFRAAVQLKPNDPVLLNNLGFIYYVMGRNDDALTYLEKTLALDPHRKEAQENIGDLYLKMGRPEEARKHYQTFLALSPASPRAQELRKILETAN